MNATAHAIGDIVFDRYRIERCLPQGGFSQNYVAIDTQSQQRVAVKQFFSEAIDEQYRDLAKRMFREEADMLRKFGAPNSQIPAWLRYIDECDSEPVIIQEFIEGETYERRVREDCVFGELAALEFLEAMLPPIAALHEAGYCHRDISPENIIRSSQHHKPVLIDFGSSAQYRCRAERRDRLRVAKQGYTAPEQQERGDFSPQSDFFSLGCTLIFLMTGCDPDTFSRDAQGILNWKEDLDISPRLLSLIDQMIALSPHDRPGSSQAIVQTLATLHEAPSDMPKKTTLLGDGAAEPLRGTTTIHSDVQTPSPPPSPENKPPIVRSFKPIVPIAAISFAVVVGLVTVGLIQRLQGADPTPPVIEAGELEPPTLPEEGLIPETPTPTPTPKAIASPTPSPSSTPTPPPTAPPANSAPSPVEAAPASNPEPSYIPPANNPEPVYAPEPYYEPAPAPAYEPEPYYEPAPVYEPEPYYPPAPAPAAAPASSLPSCADVAWGACQ
jgi:serine/threonine protein kinase